MMEHAGEEGEESYRVSMSATFILYDILVTGIELPAAMVAAINRKTEQYYIAEEYKFRDPVFKCSLGVLPQDCVQRSRVRNYSG